MNPKGRPARYTIEELRERIAKVKAYAKEHGLKEVSAARKLGITQPQLDYARTRIREIEAAGK
jgi:hypothetical protein